MQMTVDNKTYFVSQADEFEWHAISEGYDPRLINDIDSADFYIGIGTTPIEAIQNLIDL